MNGRACCTAFLQNSIGCNKLTSIVPAKGSETSSGPDYSKYSQLVCPAAPRCLNVPAATPRPMFSSVDSLAIAPFSARPMLQVGGSQWSGAWAAWQQEARSSRRIACSRALAAFEFEPPLPHRRFPKCRHKIRPPNTTQTPQTVARYTPPRSDLKIGPLRLGQKCCASRWRASWRSPRLWLSSWCPPAALVPSALVPSAC